MCRLPPVREPRVQARSFQALASPCRVVRFREHPLSFQGSPAPQRRARPPLRGRGRVVASRPGSRHVRHSRDSPLRAPWCRREPTSWRVYSNSSLRVRSRVSRCRRVRVVRCRASRSIKGRVAAPVVVRAVRADIIAVQADRDVRWAGAGVRTRHRPSWRRHRRRPRPAVAMQAASAPSGLARRLRAR